MSQKECPLFVLIQMQTTIVMLFWSDVTLIMEYDTCLHNSFGGTPRGNFSCSNLINCRSRAFSSQFYVFCLCVGLSFIMKKTMSWTRFDVHVYNSQFRYLKRLWSLVFSHGQWKYYGNLKKFLWMGGTKMLKSIT